MYRRLLSALVVSLAPWVPSPAHAQATEAPAPVATEPAEAVAAPVEPTPAPTVDAYAEAKNRVARAEGLFAQGNYDAALAEFVRSYETMLGHPARYLVLFNMAQCYEKLYLYDSAIDAYRRYLTEGGAQAEDAAVVRAKVELLEDLLGKVTLRVRARDSTPTPKYEVWLDGRRLGRDLASFSIPGGTHQIEVHASGFVVEKKPLQLTAATSQELLFELTPLAREYRGLKPTLFWVTSGVALAAAAGGATVGIATLRERSAVDEQLSAGPPESLQVGADDQRRIRRLATTTDVFFLASGVFTASAVVLAFLTDFGGVKATGQSRAQRAPLRGDFQAWRGGGALTLQGSF